jgi:IMP dehydrogenase
MVVLVGNCASYGVALRLMETGADGVLVGIGPGAACTSRGVLGIGLPMATSIMDCCQARDDYRLRTGRSVAVIADGGIRTSGEICKAIACGADGVMMGSPFARAQGAPGGGYHWGMATPSPTLPRGTRIRVGTIGTHAQIVNGPASLDNGLHNMTGALKVSMSTLGAANIADMQEVEVVLAPGINSEGKLEQYAQRRGMGS